MRGAVGPGGNETTAGVVGQAGIPAAERRLDNLLADLGITVTTTRHPAVFTVEEARQVCGAIPGEHVKNLFLKDHRGQLYLVTCTDEVRVDLKRLATQLGSGRLSFARADLLEAVLGVRPGSVTPFALMNDVEGKVIFALERRLGGAKRINLHPLHNEATSGIAGEDLLRFTRAVRHEPRLLTFPPGGDTDPSAGAALT